MATASAVSDMLTEAGVSEHDGRVVSQLVDLATRYVQEVVDDSRRMQELCKRPMITDEDIAYGLRVNADRSRVQDPPQQLMQELASEINGESLPLVNQTGGMRLPADRYLLTATNGQVPARADLLHMVGGASTLVPPAEMPKPATSQQQQWAQQSFHVQHTVVMDNTPNAQVDMEYD